MLKKQAILTTFILIVCATLTSTAWAEHENKMKTFKSAQSKDISSLNVEGVNAFLSDTVSSNDPDAPISCGFFRMEKGNPLEYTYTYDEAKIIVEGEMTIAEKGGESFYARAGDVVYFDKGATITFTTDTYGIGFYCGQRASDEI